MGDCIEFSTFILCVYRVLIYVQRMPSTNAEKGTWYTSNKATDNWPQYAAIEMKVGSRKVRQGGYDVIDNYTR